MWYVIQVRAGQERKVCDLVIASVNDDPAVRQADSARTVLKECFVPSYQAERKFQGEYRIRTLKLFPGYVVAVSGDVGELNRVLRGVRAFTRILGNENAFVPLDRTEMEFIDSFTTEGYRVIETSRAIVEGDVVTVIDGPLLGQESMIKHIDRRKGTAIVEYEGFGRTLTTEIGLVAVSKRPKGYGEAD